MKVTYPNEHGSYPEFETEIVAMHGRAFAEIRMAYCEDDLFRYGLGVQYCYGGFGEPVSARCAGFTTQREARSAALDRLSTRWPKAFPSDPIQAHEELRIMREQFQTKIAQPELF